jgi:hypothetical protein
MATELPIACSLDASELPQRLSEMADLGRTALVDTDQDEKRAELRFAGGRGIRERVEAIVAAESHCCAFLTMRVDDAPGAVVLSIEAPAGAGVILAELVDAFRGEARVS